MLTVSFFLLLGRLHRLRYFGLLPCVNPCEAVAATIAVPLTVHVAPVITKGLGLHLDDLPVPVDEARYYQRMVQEIEEHAYTIAIGAAQLSLLALYWRLFQSITPARVAILLLTALASTWFIVRVSFLLFENEEIMSSAHPRCYSGRRRTVMSSC